MRYDRQKVKLNIVTAVIAVALAFSCFWPIQPAKGDTSLWPVGPVITAKSAVVIEADTGTVLYKSNAYERYQPANISQIMTALLVLEKCGLNDIMTMSTAAETGTSGSRVGLVRRESVTIESALYAVMLASGNEVAYGLAEHVSGDVNTFTGLMNARALELGCTDTNFTSSWGADADDHYTSAMDMALIAKEAFSHEEFMKIASSAKYTIPASNLKEARPLTNRHLMIKGDVKYDYAVAGKVGSSRPAGYTGVTYASKDGMNVICVILGGTSQDAFYSETKQLCNWCFDNYTAYNIAENEFGSKSAFASLFDKAQRFTVGKSEDIITFKGSSVVIVPKGVAFNEVKRTVSFNMPEEYYHGENLVGSIQYEYGGIYVGAADVLYYNPGYPLNSDVIDQLWPSYLFRIDDVFTEEHAALLAEYLAMGNPGSSQDQAPEITLEPSATPSPTIREQNYEAISSFRRKVIIGSGIGAATVLITLYILAFEIPYLKRKRE